MNASMTPWQSWLVDYYLLATIVLAAAMAAVAFLRQPVHRISVAWGAMIALVALAVILALPGWPKVQLVRGDSAGGESQAGVASPQAGWPWNEVLPRDQVTPGAGRLGLPSAAAAPVAGELSPTTWTWLDTARWATHVFLAGSIIAGVWLVLGALEAARLCRLAWPAPARLRDVLRTVVGGGHALPQLMLSWRVGNAVAMGVVRPTILWPANVAEPGDTGGLRAVLAHEWAHIRNRDLWLLAVVRGLLVLLYPHPLYWGLRRIVRRDQEVLADARAAGGRGLEYAMSLVSWMREFVDVYPPPLAAALRVWEQPSELSRRIGVLTEVENPRLEPSRRWRWAVAIAVGVLVTSLSVVSLGGGPTTQPNGDISHNSVSTQGR
jgi:beta-lactamase regulating signal transducer with metallopeptidase domain